MKLLLDENLPKDFKREFQDFEAYTIRKKNWNGLTNGKLIRSMVADGFDVLLTLDKNLQHQQNLERTPIRVIVLQAHSNRLEDLLPLVPMIYDALSSDVGGVITIGYR